MIHLRIIASFVAALSALAVVVDAAMNWLRSRSNLCGISDRCWPEDLEQIARHKSAADSYAVALFIVTGIAVVGLVRGMGEERTLHQGLWLLCPGLVAAGIEIAQGSGVWAIGLVLSGLLLIAITPRPDTTKSKEDAPDV